MIDPTLLSTFLSPIISSAANILVPKLISGITSLTKPSRKDVEQKIHEILEQEGVRDITAIQITDFILNKRMIILDGKSSAESFDPAAESVIGTNIQSGAPVKIMPGYESSAKGLGKNIIGTQIGG